MNLVPNPFLAPSCSLDTCGLRLQQERYRHVGAHAGVLERTRRRITLEIGWAVDDDVVDQLVATERTCCPFFGLRWDPSDRRLQVDVSDRRDEPALAAIADALGLSVAAEDGLS
jgi:hypothetical protein